MKMTAFINMPLMCVEIRNDIKGEGREYINSPEYPARQLYDALLHYMSQHGFYVALDRDVKKKYPSIAGSYHEGGFGDLRFRSRYGPGKSEVQFYQDIVFENPHGGYYDFDKDRKCPYLIWKRFQVTVNQFLQFFEAHGISCEVKKKYSGADYIVETLVQSCHHSPKEWFSLSDIDGINLESCDYGRNGIDRDGQELINGCLRYCRDRNGYLQRGRCYHDLNMNWMLLTADGQVFVKSCWELFTLQDSDSRGRLKEGSAPENIRLKKEQLKVASDKDLLRELKRRGYRFAV